jgi:hypothetical protein
VQADFPTGFLLGGSCTAGWRAQSSALSPKNSSPFQRFLVIAVATALSER